MDCYLLIGNQRFKQQTGRIIVYLGLKLPTLEYKQASLSISRNVYSKLKCRVLARFVSLEHSTVIFSEISHLLGE